jgi:hypothetical protein
LLPALSLMQTMEGSSTSDGHGRPCPSPCSSGGSEAERWVCGPPPHPSPPPADSAWVWWGFRVDPTAAVVPGQLRPEEPSSGADLSTPRVDPAAPTVACARVVGRRRRVCWLVGGSSLPSPAQGCGWVAARLTGRRPSTSDGWFPTSRVVHLRFDFFSMLQSLSTDVAIGFYGCCTAPTDVASMFFECWSTRGSNVVVVHYGCWKSRSGCFQYCGMSQICFKMLQMLFQNVADVVFECCVFFLHVTCNMTQCCVIFLHVASNMSQCCDVIFFI